MIPIYKLPHKNRNNLRNAQSLKRDEGNSDEEAGFDHYMATPEKKSSKANKLKLAKG